MARPSISPRTHHTNPNVTVKDKLLHTLPCTFFLQWRITFLYSLYQSLKKNERTHIPSAVSQQAGTWPLSQGRSWLRDSQL